MFIYIKKKQYDVFCCLQYHFLQYTKHTGCSQALLTSLRITGHVIPFPSLIFGTSLLCFIMGVSFCFPPILFPSPALGADSCERKEKEGDRLKLSEDTSRRTPLPNPRESTSRIASCANGGAPRSRGLDPFPATPRPDASVRFTFASRRSSRMADASEGDFFCF